MIIGDNYGEYDTETGEQFGLGGQNGNVCNHKFEKVIGNCDVHTHEPQVDCSACFYCQCSYCGERRRDGE